MPDPTLTEWLEERRERCLRTAKEARNRAVRDEWLADASYFARCIEAVRQLSAAHGDPESANTPLRMHIALKILRAWNSGTAGYDARVVVDINAWIDGGMRGPVPWPESPFFAEWAAGAGLAKVGEYVGFRFDVELSKKV